MDINDVVRIQNACLIAGSDGENIEIVLASVDKLTCKEYAAVAASIVRRISVEYVVDESEVIRLIDNLLTPDSGLTFSNVLTSH